MSKKDETKISKPDWWNWGVTVLALIVAVISLGLNYCESSKNKEIRVETILNEAWDLMAGGEGEPLIGATVSGDTGDIDERQLNLVKRKVKEALILAPDNPKVIKMNAECLRFSMKREEAIIEFQRAIFLDPNYISAYNSLGRTFFELGRFKESESIFQKAISLDQKNAVVYINLAITQSSQGNLKAAFVSCKNAIKNDPDLSYAHNCLGIILLLQRQYNDALTAFKQAIFLDKNNTDTHNFLGLIYEKMGKLDEAFLSFKTAIRIDPLNEMAYNNLGVLYSKNGKLVDAIENLQIAIYIAPDFLLPYENLREAYLKLGDEEKAKTFEAKAKNLRKSDQEKYKDIYRFRLK